MFYKLSLNGFVAALIAAYSLLSIGSANASVALDQVVTSVNFNGEFSTTSIYSTSDIYACLIRRYLDRDYNQDGVDEFVPNKIGVSVLSPGNCGSADNRILLRDVSKFSGTAEVCNDNYDKVAISERWIIPYQVTYGSGEACGSNSSSVPKVKLKKMSSSSEYEVMCKGYGNVPVGWVINDVQLGSSQCHPKIGETDTKYTIKKIPSSGTVVSCGLPPNYSNYMTSPLSGTCADGSKRYLVSGVVDGGFTCTVPVGMVVTDITSRTGYGCSPVFQVERPKEYGKYCKEYSDFPNDQNWVVTSITSNYSKCLGRDAWVLRKAQSSMRYCDALPVPPGYGVFGFQADLCGAGYWGGTLNAFDDGATVDYLPSQLADGFVVLKTFGGGVGAGNKVYYTVGRPDVSGYTRFCYFDKYEGPVPKGYVLTGKGLPRAKCDVGSESEIHPATSHLVVCDVTNLPSNFGVIDSDVPTSDCPGGNGYRIEEMTGFSYHICSNSEIPVGYIVRSEAQNPMCPGMAAFQWYITKPSGYDEACPIQGWDRLPEGTVVLRTYYAPGCRGDIRWIIGYPGGGHTTICVDSNSIIPIGYQVVGSGSDDNCVEGSSIVIKKDNVVLDPSTFVNDEPDVDINNSGGIEYECGGVPFQEVFAGSAQKSQLCN